MRSELTTGDTVTGMGAGDKGVTGSQFKVEFFFIPGTGLLESL